MYNLNWTEYLFKKCKGREFQMEKRKENKLILSYTPQYLINVSL